MREDQIRDIVLSCTYKPGWEIWIKKSGSRLYIQLENKEGLCSITNEHTPWVSGKRYLSSWMCRQEIVGVIFSLIKDAEMHELHEWFRYKGRSIYNPHLDPDALAELASKRSSFITRGDSMTKA